MNTQLINIENRIQPMLLTSDEVRSLQGNLLVLDVQNPKFMTRMLPEGQRLNIDVSLKDIPKHQPVLMTCLTGQRSFIAAQQLIQRGYFQVYVLRGGLMAWQKAGYTVWLT